MCREEEEEASDAAAAIIYDPSKGGAVKIGARTASSLGEVWWPISRPLAGCLVGKKGVNNDK